MTLRNMLQALAWGGCMMTTVADPTLPPVGAWEDASLGNHRAVIEVHDAATAVLATVEWRRPDPNWQEKGIIVTSEPGGKRVRNALLLADSTRCTGRILFEPDAGHGRYAVYFMPVEPGQGNFPSAHYLPNVPDASEYWLGELADVMGDRGRLEALPKAQLVGFQARTAFDRFSDMQRCASPDEIAAVLHSRPDAPFLVFPEDRDHPIAMTTLLPERWVKAGPAGKFALDAQPGEVACFQLGVFAARQDLDSLDVSFSVVPGTPDTPLPASAFTCFNTGGVSWAGEPFTKHLTVPTGTIQALWCAVAVPSDCPPGTYAAIATVSAERQEPWPVALAFRIDGEILSDHGDSNPGRHSRLRWLNSTIASDDDNIPVPYVPLLGEGQTIRCLGREVQIGSNGLPEQITSMFSDSNTRIVPTAQGMTLLARSMALTVQDVNGEEKAWRFGPLRILRASAGVREWQVTGRQGNLSLDLTGRMEFDGWLGLRCRLSATAPTAVKNVHLTIPMLPEAAPYLMGMGQKGGRRPDALSWHWDADNHQDSVWVGRVNGGLRLQLRGANYERPFVNIHYHHKPLALPLSWANEGRGGCRVDEKPGTVLIDAFSGPRTIEPGQPLQFDFDLLTTPFRTLDTEAQWRDRYYHTGEGWPHDGQADLSPAVGGGATIVNVHQGNDLNPYINYPFLTVNPIREFVARAHQKDLRVKLYYTVRELSNHVTELHALRSLGDEVLAHGPGGGHQWLEEHLGGNYIQAWYQARTYDAAIITSGMSRWHNYALEGLRYLIEQTNIDGLYIDDVAYNRTIMKRVRRLLDDKPNRGLIDLHSWNHFNGLAGFASCANLYMENLPYIDRIWFGEGFDYSGSPADYWLVEISGIPFGVMGEMLQGGGNPWIGQLFGMTNRLGWGGDPRPLWAFRDTFGVAGTEMIGFWDAACPVRSSSADVLVTAYQRPGRTILALANMAPERRICQLTVDWSKLALREPQAHYYAPDIPGFQMASLFAPDAEIAVGPKRGWLLVVDEEEREAPPPLVPATQPERLLLEEDFADLHRAGWRPYANDALLRPSPEGLRIVAPAHQAAGLENGVPNGARLFTCEVAQESDQGMTWGPGMALLWSTGETIKVNLRADGQYQVEVNGNEHLVGTLVPQHGHRLLINLGDKTIRITAEDLTAANGAQHLLDLPRQGFDGPAKTVRVGKTGHGAGSRNYESPGPAGTCTVRALRIYAADE